MKPVITKFNDKTGDFEITIPVPFILKDGIEYVDMMVADIPKYEDIKDYNVFDLIRENQELKKQLEEHNLALENLAYWKGKNESKMKINRLRKENQELKNQLENCYCNRIDCAGRIKDSKLYDSLVQKIENQQKEFIEWLEKEIKETREKWGNALTNESLLDVAMTVAAYEEILSKYKEFVGGSNEE